MIAALKDAPATAFRTPSGLRLFRVNPSTGLPAASGGSAIYEAYKADTEPGTNRLLGVKRAPDEKPIRSSSEEHPLTRKAPVPRQAERAVSTECAPRLTG